MNCSRPDARGSLTLDHHDAQNAMSNLVLKVRLESLITNLEQVNRLADSVTTRELETKNLRTRLENADKMVKSLKTYTDVAKAYGAGQVEESPTRFEESMGKALEKIEALTKEIEEAQTLLDSMKNRLVPVEGQLKFTLQSDLKEKTEQSLKSLKSTRNRLNQAATANGQLLENAWKEAVGEQNQSIFSDYVDFLGGLALRDKGWDNSICQIADELISSCGNLLQAKMWDALTIPSSHGAVTLARIIRMGFPEWNIWGLPLAAHELGLVAIRVDDDLVNYIDIESNGDEQIQRQMQVCLADAFATCTMGPAYACAALLLRFNPRLAYEARYEAVDDEMLNSVFSSALNNTLPESAGGASFDETLIERFNTSFKSALNTTLSGRRVKALSDAQRAHVILRVLEKMVAHCGVAATFDSGVIEELKNEWNSALQQANPTGKLESQSLLDAWVDKLFTQLSTNPLGAVYCGRVWKPTKDILEGIVKSNPETQLIWNKERYDELKTDDQNVQYVELNYTFELRDVINAAWACRIEGLGKAQSTVQDSEKINQSALTLWRTIKDKKKVDQDNAPVSGLTNLKAAPSKTKK